MSPRRTLITYGPKRKPVRVFTEGDLCRVQWREHGRLMTKSWPDTTAGRTEARAWARGFAEAREHAGLTRTPRRCWPTMRARRCSIYCARS